MKYNSNIHHRRSIRLKGYDYSQAGLYYVTICCQDRICRIRNDKSHQRIADYISKIPMNWTKDRFYMV
jgi:hypothetical protein